MKTFEELGIAPEIVKAIQEMGFENPMPVQEEVIPLLLKDATDIVALAQTGTGKTAAYGLPIIQQVDVKNKMPQALILCPTRELCLQIAGDLTDFAKYMDDIHILPVYGGSSIENQIQKLKRGVQIIVATPGRLIDLVERKAAKLGSISKVILDEADEMLNMGFTDSINTILAEVPKTRSTLLFSATMPNEIATIARKYMRNPREVTIGSKNAGAANIKHICYTVQAKDKYQVLKRIADYNPDIYGIVFCRTRKDTQEIADKLIQDGYNADALHGELSQAQRDYVMQKFRIRNISLLVATDVAARGLDVDDLTHVINYSLPEEREAYTHRSGRTGRAGKTGTSIVIINLKEKHVIKQIEKNIGKQFIHAKIPTGREICERQLFSMVDRMERVEIDHSQIDTYLPVIYRKLEWLDKEDLIKRFVSLEFNRFLDYYKNASDIKTPDENSIRSDRKFDRKDRDDSNRRTEEGYTRLFINAGKADGLYPNQLIEMINQNNRGKKINIGKIDLMRKFSFFEIESNSVQSVIKSLKGVDFGEISISVEIAQEKDNTSQNKGYRDKNNNKNRSNRKRF